QSPTEVFGLLPLRGWRHGLRAPQGVNVATNVAKSSGEVPLQLRIPRAARRHNQRYEQELAAAHWVVVERQVGQRDRGGPNGTPHLPRRSRLQRQVQTPFEPSPVASQSLAEIYARLVPLWQRPLRERLRPPAPPTGAPQQGQERREGQR